MKICLLVNHGIGCKIGHIKWNLLAHAADKLMASFLKGLQKLIDILGESIEYTNLMINVRTFKYIV